MSKSPKAANFGDLALDLETNYDINCQLLGFDVTKFNDKGNRYQDCVLWDGNEQKKVKVWEGRNGIPLEEKNQNEWLIFSLSARQGTGKWKDRQFIGGFWNSAAPMIDTPQNSQQAPSRPPQRPNVPKSAPQGKKEPNWDAIAAGKVRHGILCAILQSGRKVSYNEVLQHTEFVITGIDPKCPDRPVEKCEQCGAVDVTQCDCVPW